MTVKTLTWKGYTYTVKPFTLGNYFSLIEGVSEGSSDGMNLSLIFRNTCKAVLQGVTPKDQAFLIADGLSNEILNAEEDIQAASDFKEEVDELSKNFISRAAALKKSAPDLTDKLVRKERRALAPKSRKGTKEEPAHSG